MGSMSLTDIRGIVTVPDAEMVPPPQLFLHESTLHGQAHVARVLVHALRLLEATGQEELTPQLWAAVYLHDVARRHDGVCRRHGRDAWARLAGLPLVEERLQRGGVALVDYPAIEYAVTVHSDGEPAASDPNYALAALLKDADALDRVRLGDLDPGRLRHPEARAMVGFARRLHGETDGMAVGPDYFARLWPRAMAMLG